MTARDEPIRATVVGGPIELRDYDHLRLAVEHEVVKPDGTTLRFPAGTLLIMLVPGGGATQTRGLASKNPAAADARDGRA